MTALTPEIERFLTEPHLAVLSTISPEGRPHGSVIWYVYEDGALWFNIAPDSKKARNLAGESRVALTIDAREWPYRAATVTGRVEQRPFDEAQARRIAVRYVGEDEGDAMHRAMMLEERMLFRLPPKRIAWASFEGWDYRAAAGPAGSG